MKKPKLEGTGFIKDNVQIAKKKILMDNSKNELNLSLDDLEKKHSLICTKCKNILQKNDVEQIISCSSSTTNEYWYCVICKICIDKEKNDPRLISLKNKTDKWVKDFYKMFEDVVYK